MKLGSNLKQIIFTVAVVAIASAVGFACLMLYVLHEEHDQIYWSRLYRAKADISALETAVESFHKEYGRYPRDLRELVQPALDKDVHRQFLEKIAPSPWGGSFYYAVEQGAAGERIKIWVVPDGKTQARLRSSELSNRTNWQVILKP